MPDTMPWDASRPFQNRPDAGTDFYNSGCPSGFFAQAVPIGAADGVDYGNPDTRMRCRASATSSPLSQMSEVNYDINLAYENVGRYNASVSLTQNWAAMAAMFAIGLLVWTKMQKGGK